MERAGAAHGLELALQQRDAVGDEAAVDFELAFARAAEKAEAAALALEMGPGPHQPRALIGQRRQLDLQAALMRARPRAENFEDQAGAVDDLAFPGALEIALLHRADRGIDDDDGDRLELGDRLRPGVSTAPVPSSVAGRQRPQPNDLRRDDVEIDGACQPDRLVEPPLRRARAHRPARSARGREHGMDDQAAPDGSPLSRAAPPPSDQASSLSLGSKSWIGCAGITVEIACL